MNVILLEKIRNLGAIGDQVKVKAGYGRNYLVPKGKAVYATSDNIAQFEGRRAELEQVAHEALAQAEARCATITGKVITIQAKASEEGKLFGSIGTREIVTALEKMGIAVAKSEITLPAGSLRNTGEYEVSIFLHSDVSTTIKVVIAPEA